MVLVHFRAVSDPRRSVGKPGSQSDHGSGEDHEQHARRADPRGKRERPEQSGKEHEKEEATDPVQRQRTEHRIARQRDPDLGTLSGHGNLRVSGAAGFAIDKNRFSGGEIKVQTAQIMACEEAGTSNLPVG
jgi:hypothetical protein